MAEVGVEASDEFIARRNLVLQSVENEAGSEWPRGSETESVQEFVPPIELDMVGTLTRLIWHLESYSVVCCTRIKQSVCNQMMEAGSKHARDNFAGQISSS